MKKVCLILFSILFLGFSAPESRSLNRIAVWQTINQMDIKYPEIVFAQAMLESGDLKSDLARHNHNLFGMRYPSKRPTTAIGVRKGHARYKNWIESVKDYKLYQTYILGKKNILSSKHYLLHLSKSYSETGDYAKRLDRVMKENKEYLTK